MFKSKVCSVVDFNYLYSEFICGRVAVCKHMHACKIKTKTKLKHRSHGTMKYLVYKIAFSL